jgi:hypothetical protein
MANLVPVAINCSRTSIEGYLRTVLRARVSVYWDRLGWIGLGNSAIVNFLDASRACASANWDSRVMLGNGV